MSSSIRAAQLADVPAMVALSEQKRSEYEHYQPVFWRKASDSQEKQQPFFERLVSRDDVITLVSEQERTIDGFVIVTLVTAPPVYEPGGTVCSIDDFCVADKNEWASIGQALLEAAMQEARKRGAVLAVVVCGHVDQPKREMLAGKGFSIATEWYVRSL